MFKKHIISLTFVFFLFILGGVKFFMSSSKSGEKAYQRLVSLSDREKKKDSDESKTQTKQVRYHVSKQALYTKDGQRLQSRLLSDRSELIFDQTIKGYELIEYFDKVTCTMQEKLYDNREQLDSFEEFSEPPSQLVRHLIAQKATYFYRGGQLFAENVDLSRYLIPDETWSYSLVNSKPIFKGHAQSVQFSFIQAPVFKAQGLQVTLNEWSPDI